MLNITNTESTRNMNAGARCYVCNSNVKNGFWNMYSHCLKHAWNATMPIVELVFICFGVVK